MKLISLVLLALLFSCGNTKEVSQETAGEPLNKNDKEILDDPLIPVDKAGRPMVVEEMILLEAIVRINKRNCPYYLEVVEGDLFFTAYPVNLPENFQVEGKRIKFEYVVSKAQSPEGCTANKVIALSNLSEI
jgi:hypothetical protein